MAVVNRCLKREVLMTYRAIMRVSKAWKASNEAETEVEKVYIRDEARELFRKNKNLIYEGEIRLCLDEAKSRLEIAHHYKNPYPRPVNFAPGYVMQSRKKKAQLRSYSKKDQKMSHCRVHGRKMTRKNIAVGHKNNYIERNVEEVSGQKQQVTMLFIVPQQLRYRRSSKRPPPKPKRLYLERDWSLSPSPPQTPDLEPLPVCLPPSLPLLPSKSPKRKKLPQPFQKENKNHSTSGKEVDQGGTGGLRRQLPKPLPRKCSNDLDIGELKRKLQVLHSSNNLTTGAMFKQKSTPKSPPSDQRAIQAKMQPLLPPTAKPRKPVKKSGTLEAYPSLSGGRGQEERGKEIGWKKEPSWKNINSSESEKNKPQLKSPLPLPRVKVPLIVPAMSPTRPHPTPKVRLGNGENGRSPLRKEEGEEFSTSPAARPVPRKRSVSKGDAELVQQSIRDQGMKLGRNQVGRRGKKEVDVPTKSPVPRRQVSKDNSMQVPPTNIQSTSAARKLSPVGQAPRSLSPLPTKMTYDGRSLTMKRRKGGGIRTPLWIAPPPPIFSPPSTPTRLARKSSRSPNRTPVLSLVSAMPTSTYSTFSLPPFQQSTRTSSLIYATPIIYTLPTPAPDKDTHRPIELAKSLSPPSQRSMDIEFENLYENKSIWKKKRVPSGQNGLPLTLMQELQHNFQIQPRRLRGPIS